ncbi:unnamed protein product [Prorocentrum cordatum]|uniref:Uncharacterized protein n=1 Tax=Prorocentrum cordatum TaxID=2364126 RepID=A0ABN9W797_9DINO|nr:unnamed protein product [Polarella glacialis]
MAETIRHEADGELLRDHDWSLWSYFDPWGASPVTEPAPAVRPAGPPRLRVRERKASRGLCGIDPDDMCGEVEVVDVEGDRSLYKIPQAYPVLAAPGGAEQGGRACGAASLLGRQAGI